MEIGLIRKRLIIYVLESIGNGIVSLEGSRGRELSDFPSQQIYHIPSLLPILFSARLLTAFTLREEEGKQSALAPELFQDWEVFLVPTPIQKRRETAVLSPIMGDSPPVASWGV